MAYLVTLRRIFLQALICLVKRGFLLMSRTGLCLVTISCKLFRFAFAGPVDAELNQEAGRTARWREGWDSWLVISIK